MIWVRWSPGRFHSLKKLEMAIISPLQQSLNSFNDIIEAYKANGSEHSFTQVPVESFLHFL